MKQTLLNINKCVCIASMLCILITTGCKKMVHVDDPADSMATSAVFSNDSLAVAAVTGIYIKFMGNARFLFNGGISLYAGMSADELQRNSTVGLEVEFYNNSISSTNSVASTNLWKTAYANIYQCNICIEGLKKSTGVSDGIKLRLQGEVLFIRALCYFYLVNLYGAVPLALGTNADVNSMLSRSPIGQVYQQIEVDLTTASESLTNDKPNTTPTKYSAQALLARVYLYMKNWSKAAELASEVINSGQFMLENIGKVFQYDNNNNKETIFQLAPVADRMNTGEGFVFVQSSPNMRPTYNLSTNLLNAFEVNDLRKLNWVKSGTLSQQPFNSPLKYKIYLSSMITEYNIVLRLAEQYLIRAEALAQQNQIENAVMDINRIRERAGLLPVASTISYDECLQRIQKERRIELFAEWGHRWFDLKRTNQVDSVMRIEKPNFWNIEDQLYPIPLTELENGPNLKQNPGYE